MKEITFTTSIQVYQSLNELSQDNQQLMQKAIDARKNAYAPYSRFKVGVAILLENGECIIGSNQENAAYPSGLCAERVAIFYAGANYPGVAINKMFITASPEDRELDQPIPPCGACRQSIVEYEINQKKPIEIYFMGSKGNVYKSNSLKNLLPFTFEKEYL
jgi:cytidine deaminase